jgi:hypothetical protein
MNAEWEPCAWSCCAEGRQHQPTGTTVVPKLPQVDPLPGAQIEPPSGNGQLDRTAKNTALYMRRHVVRPFVGVNKAGIVFRYQVIQKAVKVAAHRWICIFVDGQARRGMLDEYLKHPLAQFFDFRKVVHNQARYQVETSRMSR